MIKGTMTITQDTNFRGLQLIAQRVRAGVHSVLVGVPEGKTNREGTSLGLVLATVEFGKPEANPPQPERPVLRQLGARRHRRTLVALNTNNLQAMVAGRGMTEERALNLLGAGAAGIVKKGMSEPIWAPNAPSTIAKKGSDQPTIETAQLRQGITWQIENAGLHGATGAGAGANTRVIR